VNSLNYRDLSQLLRQKLEELSRKLFLKTNNLGFCSHLAPMLNLVRGIFYELSYNYDFSRWKFLLIFQLNVKTREFGARKTPITRNLVVLQDKGR